MASPIAVPSRPSCCSRVAVANPVSPRSVDARGRQVEPDELVPAGQLQEAAIGHVGSAEREMGWMGIRIELLQIPIIDLQERQILPIELCERLSGGLDQAGWIVACGVDLAQGLQQCGPVASLLVVHEEMG